MPARIFLLTFALSLFCSSFSQKLPSLIPYRKGDKWGYCDSTKKIIIEPKYDWAPLFYKGYARVEADNKKFFIDEKGNIVKMPKAFLKLPDFISCIDYFVYSSYGTYVFKKKKKYGLKNFKNEITLPA